MELARQQQDTDKAQERHRQPLAARWRRCENLDDFRVSHRPFEEIGGSLEQDEHDENANEHECSELHDTFERNREHQAVLVLGGITVAGAE